MKEILPTTIERAARGDMAAFEEIYRAAAGMVYATALRITANTADADEVTQDVFVKIFQNLRRFQFRSSLKTWIYRITVNTAINAYRRGQREAGRRADFDVALATTGVAAHQYEVLEHKDRQALADRLLARLNPEQRACLVLREIQGLRYEEIAEVLNVNVNTVRSRLRRARLALMALGSEVVKDEV